MAKFMIAHRSDRTLENQFCSQNMILQHSFSDKGCSLIIQEK